MEWLFRRHFWLVHFSLAACSAFLLVGTINVTLSHFVAEKLSVGKKKNRSPKSTLGAKNRSFSPAEKRNLFDAKRETIALKNLGASEEILVHDGDGDCDDAAKTSLSIRVVGTAVFEEEERSLVTIIELGGSDKMPKTYSTKSCPDFQTPPVLAEDVVMSLLPLSTPCNRLLNKATIKRIEPERVCFFNDSKKRYEYASLFENSNLGGRKTSRKSKPRKIKKKKVSGKGIRKISENSYEIERAELDSALSNLSKIATQARAVPHFSPDGKPVGFKIFAIQPNSIFSKLGIRNGDVVTRVNGHDLDSPDKALQLYQKLQTSDQFNIDIERGGRKITKDYTVGSF